MSRGYFKFFCDGAVGLFSPVDACGFRFPPGPFDQIIFCAAVFVKFVIFHSNPR